MFEGAGESAAFERVALIPIIEAPAASSATDGAVRPSGGGFVVAAGSAGLHVALLAALAL